MVIHAKVFVLDIDIGVEDILCDDRFLAPGYGQLNAPTSAAIKMLANREGIMLDPTYSGKAFAALVDRIENENFSMVISVKEETEYRRKIGSTGLRRSKPISIGTEIILARSGS